MRLRSRTTPRDASKMRRAWGLSSAARPVQISDDGLGTLTVRANSNWARTRGSSEARRHFRHIPAPGARASCAPGVAAAAAQWEGYRSAPLPMDCRWDMGGHQSSFAWDESMNKTAGEARSISRGGVSNGKHYRISKCRSFARTTASMPVRPTPRNATISAASPTPCTREHTSSRPSGS
jgi:hypothetical protein